VNFTKRRFLSFHEKQRHKKCAELLREIYEGLLSKQDISHLWQHYNEIQAWRNEIPLDLCTAKTVCDRYHEHLRDAGVSLKEHNLLPVMTQGDRQESAMPWPIAIYLDHIRSAHNVGSILRTVEALALGSVYFSEGTPKVSHKQVQDASMGSYQWVECHQGKTLHALPKPIIVMETSPSAISLCDFLFPETFTLVMGNEEYGCSDYALGLADYIVEIPLRGRKNSLNVANAFAIVAAEIARQRRLSVF